MLIYTEVAGLTSNFKDDFTRSFCGVVTQIEQMSQQEQLLALRDLLTGGGVLPYT